MIYQHRATVGAHGSFRSPEDTAEVNRTPPGYHSLREARRAPAVHLPRSQHCPSIPVRRLGYALSRTAVSLRGPDELSREPTGGKGSE